MMKEMAVFIVLAILVLPIASSAQSSNSSGKSIEDLNAASVPEGSIVVLSTEETEVPGYVHQKYAYACFGGFQLVDYYGAPIEPKPKYPSDRARDVCTKALQHGGWGK